jgi:hypothetical protein
MDPLAAWLGTVLGHALRACLPELKTVIADAVREAITPTMEDAARQPVRNALEEAVRRQMGKVSSK